MDAKNPSKPQKKEVCDIPKDEIKNEKPTPTQGRCIQAI